MGTYSLSIILDYYTAHVADRYARVRSQTGKVYA